MPPSLHLILARAANGVIGKHGKLPWHLPEDLAHFKHTTMGHPVLMGRKTWDALPERVRPLPGRRNLVLTHQDDWHENGAEPSCSLAQALRLCEHENTIWIIGGAQLYALAAPFAHQAVVTEIAQDFDGDAFAPVLSASWHETARTQHHATSGLAYSIVTYRNDHPHLHPAGD